jgi:hypothetical protein
MTYTEHHPNGNVSYTETWAEYDEKIMGLRTDSKPVTHSDGIARIRVGTHGKYDVEGNIVWEFIYDRNGKKISFKKRPECSVRLEIIRGKEYNVICDGYGEVMTKYLANQMYRKYPYHGAGK